MGTYDLFEMPEAPSSRWELVYPAAGRFAHMSARSLGFLWFATPQDNGDWSVTVRPNDGSSHRVEHSIHPSLDSVLALS